MSKQQQMHSPIDHTHQGACIFEFHEGIVMHKRMMVKEQELDQIWRRIRHNGIQGSQLFIPHFATGEIKRMIGL
jgi:hypothetical protein